MGRIIPINSDEVLYQRASDGKDIIVSLHSSARMKLLGKRLCEFDALDPEVASRITQAVRRMIDGEEDVSSPLILTALDID